MPGRKGSLDFYPTYGTDGKSESYYFLIDLKRLNVFRSTYAVECLPLAGGRVGPRSAVLATVSHAVRGRTFRDSPPPPPISWYLGLECLKEGENDDLAQSHLVF